MLSVLWVLELPHRVGVSLKVRYRVIYYSAEDILIRCIITIKMKVYIVNQIQ